MPISLQGLANKRSDVTVTWGEDTSVLVFNPNLLTKQFRAEVLRLQRAFKKSQRRMEMYLETAILVAAPDGSIEAIAEDEAAEAAIQAMMTEDEALKRSIDNAFASVMVSWDVTDKPGGKVVPIFIKDKDTGLQEPSPELFDVPADFETTCLMAILDQSPASENPEGEAPGASSLSTTSPLPLKPRAKQATSRRSPTSTRSSKRPRTIRALSRGNG